MFLGWTAADIHKQLSCTNCTNKSDKIEHFKCLSLVVPPRVGYGAVGRFNDHLWFNLVADMASRCLHWTSYFMLSFRLTTSDELTAPIVVTPV